MYIAGTTSLNRFVRGLEIIVYSGASLNYVNSCKMNIIEDLEQFVETAQIGLKASSELRGEVG